MKNFNKRMAAREGFTLVELIVVIAILAILAAVSYPAYTGYISKSKETSDLTALSSVSTAVQGACATTGDSVKTMEFTFATSSSTKAKLKITFNGSTAAIEDAFSDTENTVSKTIQDLVGDEIQKLESKSGKKTATWGNSEGTYKWTLSD